MDTKALATRLVDRYDTRDPFRIADEMGFIVVFAPLVDMRGFQQRIKRRNIVYINADLEEPQCRLVCAHELGHHFLHRGMNRIFMDHSTQIITQKFENEAHMFSLELVYSDDELRPFLNRSITNAAAYMGITVSLAAKRLRTIPTPRRWTD